MKPRAGRVLEEDNRLSLLLGLYQEQGDEAAIDDLVASTRPKLVNIAARVAGHDEAEDVVQSAYLALVRQKRPAREILVMPWLITTVLRRAYRARAKAVRMPQLAERLTIAAGDAGPLESAEHTEELELLASAVDQLPEIYRDSLVLHHLHGLRTTEVASLLQIPHGTVLTRLHRGRALLESRLSPRLRVLVLFFPWLFADLASAAIPGPAALAAIGGLLKTKSVVLGLFVLVLCALTLPSWLPSSDSRTDSATVNADPGSSLQGRNSVEALVGEGERRTTKVVPTEEPAGATLDSQSDPKVAADLAAASTSTAEFETLSGIVVDEFELPVVGAQVIARTHRIPTESSPENESTAISGTDGAFSLKSKSKQPYWIEATEPEQGLVQASEVNAMSGATGVKVVLVHAASITGVVKNADGETVGAASVRITIGGVSARGRTDGKQVDMRRHLRTDEQGRFQATMIPPGRTVLTADDPQYLESKIVMIDLAAGEVRDDIQLVLERPASIRGKVITTAGVRVAGASVEANYFDRRPLPAIESSAICDANGEFVLERLSPTQSYMLTAFATGLATRQDLHAPELHTGGAQDALITMVAGASVSGRVIFESGEPVEAASVGIAPVGSFEALNPRLTTVTIADGTFQLEGIAPGTHILSFGRGVWLEHASPRSRDQIELTLKEGEARRGLELIVREPGVITGTVVDTKNNPLSQILLSISGPTAGRGAVTGADGRFRIECGEHGGNVSITQVTWRDGTSYLFVDPPDGSRPARPGDDLRFVLSRGVTVRGRVIDESGMPVNAKRVSVFSPAINPERETAESSTNGEFKVVGLPEGVLTVRIQAEGYADLVVAGVRAAAESEVDMGELVLASGSILRGRVEDAKGAAVPAASVTVSYLGRPRFWLDRNKSGVRTDETGTFELANLSAGRAVIQVEHSAHARGWQAVTLPHEGELVLSMKMGGAISGIVTGADEAIPGVNVRCQRVRLAPSEGALIEPNLEVISAEDGGFRFDLLPAGQYRVTAELPSGALGRQGVHLPKWLMARVEVRDGENSRCDLRHDGCRVRGRVLGRTGDLGEDDNVYLYGESSNFSTEISREGVFQFESVPPGELTLSINRLGSRLITIPDASEFEIEIIAPAGFIQGTVRRSSGATAGGVSVRARGRSGEEHGTSTDGDGTYRIDNLATGSYDVIASKSGLGTAVVHGAQVGESDGASAVDLVIEENCLLHLRVVDHVAQPIFDPVISCRDAAGVAIDPSGLASATLARGELEISGLSPGTYRIAAGAPGLGTSWIDDVIIAPEQQAQATIALAGGRGRFELLLRHASAPAAGQRFELHDAGGLPVVELDQSRARRHVRVNHEGRYTSGLLPAGKYKLRFQFGDAETVEREAVIAPDGSTLALEIDI